MQSAFYVCVEGSNLCGRLWLTTVAIIIQILLKLNPKFYFVSTCFCQMHSHYVQVHFMFVWRDHVHLLDTDKGIIFKIKMVYWAALTLSSI